LEVLDHSIDISDDRLPLPVRRTDGSTTTLDNALLVGSVATDNEKEMDYWKYVHRMAFKKIAFGHDDEGNLLSVSKKSKRWPDEKYNTQVARSPIGGYEVGALDEQIEIVYTILHRAQHYVVMGPHSN
jgi:hypothetical protein